MSRSKEYTWEDLVNDVRKEATSLREHATKDEILKLSKEWLDPISWYGCIYGQLTGDCYSERAKYLIQKSCKRYFKDFDIHEPSKKTVLFGKNGAKVDIINLRDRRRGGLGYLSSIEAYILVCGKRAQTNLIKFIKGQRADII